MGANVHLKNDYGLYPIHFAASRGNKDLCRILVSYKEVDVNVTDHGLVRLIRFYEYPFTLPKIYSKNFLI